MVKNSTNTSLSQIVIKEESCRISSKESDMTQFSLFDRKFQLEDVTAEKDQLLADKDEEIAARQEELKQKEQAIQQLENEISESNEYLAEIESTVDEVGIIFSFLTPNTFTVICPCLFRSTESPLLFSSRKSFFTGPTRAQEPK